MNPVTGSDMDGPDPGRLDDLLLRWKEDAISPAELEELVALLQTREGRRALVEEFYFARTIHDVLSPTGCDDHPPAPRSLAPLGHTRGRRASSRAWWGYAAAAAVVLVVGGLGLHRVARVAREGARPPITESPITDPGPQRPPAAAGETASAIVTLLETGGSVRVLTPGGDDSPAAAGTEVLAGQTLQTGGEDGFAALGYSDGTRLLLSPGTVVRVETENDGDAVDRKRLFVSRGVLRADVAPQPQSRPMVVASPQVEVVVLGTKFTAATGPGATRVELEQGRVQLVRTADRRAIEVRQGAYVVATADPEPLVARPLPARLERPRLVTGRAEAEVLALSPDGRWLAVGKGPELNLWDVGGRGAADTAADAAAAPAAAFALDGLRHPARSLAFSPDGKTLAAGDGRGHLHLWELSSRRPGPTIDLGGFKAGAMAFSGDGRWLAVVVHRANGNPAGVRIYEAAAGREHAARPAQADGVRFVAWSAAAGAFAGTTSDGQVVFWDPATGRERLVLRGPQEKVSYLALSPDGAWAAQSDGRSVRLWDVGRMEVRWTVEAVGRSVCALAFAPDGRTVAAGAGDGTVELLSADDGRAVAAAHAEDKPVRWLAFTPDGRTLVTGGFLKPVKLWDVPDDPEVTGDEQRAAAANGERPAGRPRTAS